jgi:hypothetical protein
MRQHSPFPSETDVAILRHVVRFARADEARRAEMRTATISAEQVTLLLRFAQRMAHAAVVKRELRLVQAGLLALAMVGQRASPRSLWRVMGLLQFSAEKLTPHPEQLFRKGSFMASSSGIDELVDSYLNRDAVATTGG